MNVVLVISCFNYCAASKHLGYFFQELNGGQSTFGLKFSNLSQKLILGFKLTFLKEFLGLP